MRSFTLAAAVLAVAGANAPADAALLLKTINVSSILSPPLTIGDAYVTGATRTSLVVPEFNARLGTLRSLTIAFDATLQTTIKLSKIAPSNAARSFNAFNLFEGYVLHIRDYMPVYSNYRYGVADNNFVISPYVTGLTIAMPASATSSLTYAADDLPYEIGLGTTFGLSARDGTPLPGTPGVSFRGKAVVSFLYDYALPPVGGVAPAARGARAFALAAAGVPEPASWAMLLTGFGALGATLRRRPRVLLA